MNKQEFIKGFHVWLDKEKLNLANYSGQAKDLFFKYGESIHISYVEVATLLLEK